MLGVAMRAESSFDTSFEQVQYQYFSGSLDSRF
jgi:hypothetical protein